MSQLQHARSFKDLIVYHKARATAKRIFQISKRFPKEEMYSLTDQARRSSRSVGAQIAEAWAKRRYPSHFVSKLTDSDGELQETRHWISRAAAYGYLNEGDTRALGMQCDSIGAKLGRMIQNPDQFC